MTTNVTNEDAKMRKVAHKIAGLVRRRPVADVAIPGIVIEIFLFTWWLVLVFPDYFGQQPFSQEKAFFSVSSPPLILLVIALIAVFEMAMLLLSYIWTLYPTREKPEQTEKKLTAGRVVFVVFYSYVIIGALVGASLVSTTGQQTIFGGLTSSQMVVNGSFTATFRVISNVSLGLFESRAFVTPLTASLDFLNSSITKFLLQISLTQVQAPFQAADLTQQSMNLSNTVHRNELLLLVATKGLQAGNYKVGYSAHYVVSRSSTNSTGITIGALNINVRSGSFSGVWYFVFLFLGILTSFWWRIANRYLGPSPRNSAQSNANSGSGGSSPGGSGNTSNASGNQDMKPDYQRAELRSLAFMILIPLLSAVIASVIFGQVLSTLSSTTDPLVISLSGFAYGFFWENATKKFGSSISQMFGSQDGE